MKGNYYDRTLLRLRRQYSKDETVAALSKKLSLMEVENGKLTSEIDHLTFTLKEERNRINDDIQEVMKEHPMFIEQKKLIKQRGKLISELQIKNKELINKLSKYENI